MNITIQSNSDSTTVFLVGEMDALGCNQARPELESIITGYAGKAITLCMSKVTFIDSSGIGAIVFLYKRLCAANGSLRVVGANGQPRELMELLRIDKAIEVEWEDTQPAKVAAQS